MTDDLKRKVILIEDHDYFRSSLKSIISEMGGFIIVAEINCDMGAVETAGREQADLIILDFPQCKESAYDLIAEIKKVSAAKVLIYAINADPGFVEEALRLGADGICAKGLKRHDFVVAIEETLNEKRPVFVPGFGGVNLSHGPGHRGL